MFIIWKGNADYKICYIDAIYKMYFMLTVLINRYSLFRMLPKDMPPVGNGAATLGVFWGVTYHQRRLIDAVMVTLIFIFNDLYGQ